jgi:hypothetical protein
MFRFSQYKNSELVFVISVYFKLNLKIHTIFWIIQNSVLEKIFLSNLYPSSVTCLIYAFIAILLFTTVLDQASRHHAVTSTHVTVPKDA